MQSCPYNKSAVHFMQYNKNFVQQFCWDLRKNSTHERAAKKYHRAANQLRIRLLRATIEKLLASGANWKTTMFSCWPPAGWAKPP